MRLGLPVANLPGAGAKPVEKVCIDRITGNRSRQRGTTRMEDDPASRSWTGGAGRTRSRTRMRSRGNARDQGLNLGGLTG